MPSLRIESDTLRSIGAVLAVGAIGALTVMFPLAVCRSWSALRVLRGKYAFRDAMALMLAGNMALSYGFANIGLKGFLPIPFSDGLLMMLVAWTLVYQKSLRGFGRPAIFMAASLAWPRSAWRLTSTPTARRRSVTSRRRSRLPSSWSATGRSASTA